MESINSSSLKFTPDKIAEFKQHAVKLISRFALPAGYLTGFGVNAGDIDIEDAVDEIEADLDKLFKYEPIEVED